MKQFDLRLKMLVRLLNDRVSEIYIRFMQIMLLYRCAF